MPLLLSINRHIKDLSKTLNLDIPYFARGGSYSLIQQTKETESPAGDGKPSNPNTLRKLGCRSYLNLPTFK